MPFTYCRAHWIRETFTARTREKHEKTRFSACFYDISHRYPPEPVRTSLNVQITSKQLTGSGRSGKVHIWPYLAKCARPRWRNASVSRCRKCEECKFTLLRQNPCVSANLGCAHGFGDTKSYTCTRFRCAKVTLRRHPYLRKEYLGQIRSSYKVS